MREEPTDAVDRGLLDALRRHGTDERFDADRTWALVSTRRADDVPAAGAPPRHGLAAVLPLAAAAAVAVLGLGPSVLGLVHPGPSTDRPSAATGAADDGVTASDGAVLPVGTGTGAPAGPGPEGTGPAGTTVGPAVATAAGPEAVGVGPSGAPSAGRPSPASGTADGPGSVPGSGPRSDGGPVPAPSSAGASPADPAATAGDVLLAADPDGPGVLDASGPDGWVVFTGTGWERRAHPAADVALTVEAPPGAAVEPAGRTVRWGVGERTASGSSSRRLAGAESGRWTVTVPASGRSRTLRVHGGGVRQGLQVTVAAGRAGSPVTASWDDGPRDAFVLTVVLPAGTDPRTVVLEPTDGSRVAVAAVTVTAA